MSIKKVIFLGYCSTNANIFCIILLYFLTFFWNHTINGTFNWCKNRYLFFFFQQSAWYDGPLHKIDKGNFFDILSRKRVFVVISSPPYVYNAINTHVYCRAKIKPSFQHFSTKIMGYYFLANSPMLYNQIHSIDHGHFLKSDRRQLSVMACIALGNLPKKRKISVWNLYEKPNFFIFRFFSPLWLKYFKMERV